MVLPWKVTVKGLRLRQQPTRRRRALYCDLERREDVWHGGRVRPPFCRRDHRRSVTAGTADLRTRGSLAWRRRRARRLLLATTLDRAHNDLKPEPDDDEIGDHLPGDHQPRRLGLGGDIAEPDRGENGDGEIQRVGACQRLGEVAGGNRVQDDVGAGEQQQEQRNAGGEGFDPPQARER
jgi:hypothetical protein